MKQLCQRFSRTQQSCIGFYDVLFSAIKAVPAKTACEEANFCAKKVENNLDNAYPLVGGLDDVGFGNYWESLADTIADSLMNDKNCEACHSFYDSVKQSHMKVSI
jgi:hypothetical protein